MHRTVSPRRPTLALAALLAGLVTAAPAPAAEPTAPAAGPGAAVAAQSTFCEGTYALCIKAPCSAIPTLDRILNYYVDHALCSCEVVKGWSMGPGACEDRAPVVQNGRTYLISTYSNLFNAKEKTLSCGSAETKWAWCYGAPCVADPKDPHKALCTCPVMTGPGKTLGGDCNQDACSGIWSAATPAGDVFANEHFYRTMQKDHPGVPANPPAAACPVTTTPGTPGG